MKRKETVTLIIVLILSLVFIRCSMKSSNESTGDSPDTNGNPVRYILHLLKARGTMELKSEAVTDTYEAYFHIPIAFREQVPVYLDIRGDELVDYRFVRLSPPNVIVCAVMKKAVYSKLEWEAWVMVREVQSASSGLPSVVAMPSPEELPADTRKWLGATSCVQVDDPLVRETAASVRDDNDNLRQLSNRIAFYCRYDIVNGLHHDPWSFDAVSALKWGNSCTGHAHAGAALFRANGIPARSILNISASIAGSLMDMHWIIDYYLPGHEWIKMETTSGEDEYESQNTVIVMVCEPEYENPLFYPCGIEGFWFSSDPAVGIPDWGLGHYSVFGPHIDMTGEEIDRIHTTGLEVWDRYIDVRGINLTPEEQGYVESADLHREDALAKLRNNNPRETITALQNALDNLEKIEINPVHTVFFDDFENGGSGWSHGGTGDEWELGAPAYDSITAYSGTNCWGTDLDDTYENNADCWLLSPVIDLANLSCAYLSVYIRNSLAGDDAQEVFFDPLWLDISTDGKNFRPLCTAMGGVNDDPEVPDNGGWGFLALDLTRYVGSSVRVRFRLQSDAGGVNAGAHIDDFHVYGR